MMIGLDVIPHTLVPISLFSFSTKIDRSLIRSKNKVFLSSKESIKRKPETHTVRIRSSFERIMDVGDE
ncbi:hypothetical protein MtrunA17_Chr2g0332531 [Medicago truncatula]|uniref:Uncharacterized protein n=1 Tax=Medicago truncatula TaxID=3880 RepID=A0A396JJK3_MEDTR|nr:hypothetical protein MtrunA17_Chr2g0332531 [Medicago truncatula]